MALLKASSPCMGRYSLFSSESIMIFSACKSKENLAQAPPTSFSLRHIPSVCYGCLCLRSSCGAVYARPGSKEACLLDDIKDIWLQLLCPVGSHAEIELQIICVPLERLADSCTGQLVLPLRVDGRVPVHAARNKAPDAKSL